MGVEGWLVFRAQTGKEINLERSPVISWSPVSSSAAMEAEATECVASFVDLYTPSTRMFAIAFVGGGCRTWNARSRLLLDRHGRHRQRRPKCVRASLVGPRDAWSTWYEDGGENQWIFPGWRREKEGMDGTLLISCSNLTAFARY